MPEPIDTAVALDWPPYRSSRLRHPERLVPLPERLADLEGPAFGEGALDEGDGDLTRQGAGEPLGERIVVQGRVLDQDGRPVAGALVEVWQANAAGRYLHDLDRHPAPLDPSFTGGGRCLTDREGRYRFTTIKPGAYPWQNHDNAWRPAHIHFSLFGRLLSERLVTQMYFPGDPLLEHDPIYQAVREPRARELLVARLDLDVTEEGWALGYTWDVVLGRGSSATPRDRD